MGSGFEVRGWRIRGRVQGVGFRWHTMQTARGLGLRGRVWNNTDGSVEVHAGGAAESLAVLGRWLSQGPPAARVEGVEEIDAGPSAEAEGFHAIVRGA